MTSASSSLTTQTSREALLGSALFIFLVLGMPLGLAGAPQTFNDGDVSWHLATGEWILRHQRGPGDRSVFLHRRGPTVGGDGVAGGRHLRGRLQPRRLCRAGDRGCRGADGAARDPVPPTAAYLGPLALAAVFIGLDLVLAPFILARPHVLVWPCWPGGR